MGLWPQFKSPLIWDVFAVSTYATVSVVFWYVGLIPDLATMRDRAVSKSEGDDLRHAVARLARLGAPLAPLRGRHADSRGPVDAAGALGPHRREFRLRGVADSRLARDDLPALLRGRRHLLRLRHGALAGHSGAPLLRHGKPDHDAPHRQHGQGHAGDGPDRRLRLRDGSVLRVVQRQPARALHDVEPHVRALRVVVLDADLDQRRDGPGAVVQARPHQHGAAVRDVDLREHRHVARALRDHRHLAQPRLRALVLGHVLPDAVGLHDVLRNDRPVPDAVPAVPALRADDFDLRSEDAAAAGRKSRRTTMHTETTTNRCTA